MYDHRSVQCPSKLSRCAFQALKTRNLPLVFGPPVYDLDDEEKLVIHNYLNFRRYRKRRKSQVTCEMTLVKVAVNIFLSRHS